MITFSYNSIAQYFSFMLNIEAKIRGAQLDFHVIFLSTKWDFNAWKLSHICVEWYWLYFARRFFILSKNWYNIFAECCKYRYLLKEEKMEILSSFSVLKEQICYLIDLLRPIGTMWSLFYWLFLWLLRWDFIVWNTFSICN